MYHSDKLVVVVFILWRYSGKHAMSKTQHNTEKCHRLPHQLRFVVTPCNSCPLLTLQYKLVLTQNLKYVTLFVLHSRHIQVACPCGSMISSIFPLCIPQSGKIVIMAFTMMLLYMYSTEKTSILSLIVFSMKKLEYYTSSISNN